MDQDTTNRKGKMKQKIITFLAKLKTISEQYFMIVSILGALWGGFLMYDNWKHNNDKLQINVTKIIEAQMHQGKTDSLLLVNQSEIQSQLQGIQATTNSLQSSYVKYISNDKTLTKQDFLRYMEGLSFDVKKNSMTSEQKLTRQLTPSPK